MKTTTLDFSRECWSFPTWLQFCLTKKNGRRPTRLTRDTFWTKTASLWNEERLSLFLLVSSNSHNTDQHVCEFRKRSSKHGRNWRFTSSVSGKRLCLGENLARMELFLFFTSFMQHFSFSMPAGVEPVLDYRAGLTLAPKPYKICVQASSEK